MARRPRKVGRTAKSYMRRAPTKEPYDVVLIVCEGTKTERFYFIRLREIHRLSSTNIQVTSANGSDPISIVTFAEERVDDFDRVFCVFDRDNHQNYDAALRRIADSNGSGKLNAITSWPCFEFWILLHFKFSSAAFVSTGRRSPCDNVIGELRNHIRDYSKGHATIFDDLQSSMHNAIAHAERLSRENAQTLSKNPSTKVHELVKYLLQLRR